MLDNFDDRYLGAKSSDPALDNDGNALLLGALYFNTTDGVMKVYTASSWIAASSASVATLATFEFVATAGQTVFSGNDANGSSLSYVAPALIVTLNGVRLRPGDDYTATNGTSITLISAAALNDELVVDAFGSFLVANTYTIAEVDAFAVKLTGNQSIAGNKNFAGNTLFVDDTNDRVGIGTNAPTVKLDVGGTSGDTVARFVNTQNSNGNFAYIHVGPANGGGALFGQTGHATTTSQYAWIGNSGDDVVGGGVGLHIFRGTGNLRHMNLPAYMCRAWVNFDGTGTPAIRGSGNVSSITDNGVGDNTINFITSMPDANYSVTQACGVKAIAWGLHLFAGLSGYGNNDALATNRFRAVTVTPADNNGDTPILCYQVFR